MTSASDQPPAAFEILVRGELTEALVDSLVPLRLRVEPAGPVALRGAFRDQAELLGALQALEELGVELIEVVTVDDVPDDEQAAPGDEQAAAAPGDER